MINTHNYGKDLEGCICSCCKSVATYSDKPGSDYQRMLHYSEVMEAGVESMQNDEYGVSTINLNLCQDCIKDRLWDILRIASIRAEHE